jgi:ABC-type polysaccharide transport system permease subunit
LSGETDIAKAEGEGARRQRTAGTNTALVLIIELLFLALPLIIYGGIFGYKGRFSQLWALPEWSFAAVVLCGLTLTKFTSGILSKAEGFQMERVLLFIVIPLIVGVLSLLVLFFVLNETIAPANQQAGQAAAAEKPLPSWLFWAQLVIFLISLLCFILIGGTGEYNKIKAGKE